MTSFRPLRWESVGPSFRSAQFAGEVEVAVVDDLAVDVDDDQLAGSDFDDRGDVLVDVFFMLGQGVQAASVSDATIASTSVDSAGQLSEGPLATTTTMVPSTSAAMSRTVLPSAIVRLSVVSMLVQMQSLLAVPST